MNHAGITVRVPGRAKRLSSTNTTWWQRISTGSLHVPRLVASALLLLALPACGDDGAEDGSGAGSSGEASSGDAASDSTADTTVAVDSGTETSGGMAEPGACMHFPTTPAIGYVFVAGGADAGTCDGEPQPCTGDPVGEWTLASSCGAVPEMPANPFEESCPGGDYTPEMPVQTGTLSVAPGGAFELSTSTTYDYVLGADITCLGAFDCGADAESILTGITGGTASCEGEVFACYCTVTGAVVHSDSAAGDGASGDRPLLVSDDGSIHPFCAADGRIAVWSLPTPPTAEGTPCEGDDDCEASSGDQIVACIP